ncbi:CubicO group peptidase (beta-lactamase class C family) [Stackebrandtia albiflava]|uniref:CubicO group peptidase (Beta-lactamase class C family) n=1 Tax=Stackebrandtia albiflava TaxID=406432 RepID=A0A562V570_9ACTN|nr:serine hydrolase domain-containing protein [Stackebrandtia albiflava]TWJ13005.1 CubicO group peptidase (beta-lactamase class C family) [Stackebrandtia albiflava]
MPEIGGTTAPGYEAVRDAFAANLRDHGEIGGAVAAYVDGREVVDLWGGSADPDTGRAWRHDTLQVVYSVTKAFTAACAHLLAQRGTLDLDAPVARYWPEFAAAGKEHIPVRWLLTHQAGLSAIDSPVTPDEAVRWEPVVSALAAQRPEWEPGTAHGYHGLTYGWLVGEVIRRVSGVGPGVFLRREIAVPHDLDLWIGLPEAQRERVSRIVAAAPDFDSLTLIDPADHPEPLRDMMAAYADPDSLTMRTMKVVTPPLDHNRPEELAAEMPSTNGACTARALAGFYAALIGEVGGRRILSADTLADATAERVSGVDRVLKVPVRIATGFGLPTPDTFWYTPAAFGFPGLGGSLGFADPATGLAFGYVTNHVREGVVDRRAESLLAAVRDGMAGG